MWYGKTAIIFQKMNDRFQTIATNYEGLYKEKGSKFHAFAFPIQDGKMVKMYVDKLKKIHFDARHHCYAYILGADKSKTRANDDGEPAHTAGTPILNQIRSSGLTNILVVVVRYFGGTKLGVPGLITAYKLAAAAVLNNVEIVEQLIEERITVSASFVAMNEILKMLKQFQGTLVAQKFIEERTEISIDFRVSVVANVLVKIKSLQVIGVDLQIVKDEDL
jgi:uncharacterized YigZ family protein